MNGAFLFYSSFCVFHARCYCTSGNCCMESDSVMGTSGNIVILYGAISVLVFFLKDSATQICFIAVNHFALILVFGFGFDTPCL